MHAKSRLVKTPSLLNRPRPPRGSILPPLQTDLIRTARLPRTQDHINDVINALPILDLRKDGRPALADLRSVAFHDAQIRAHRGREIDLVDDQQVTARDAGAAFTRDLVTARDVDHVDDEVGQLARVVGSQVVAAGLDQEQVRLELALQGLQGQQVGADVLAHGGVRAASGFDGTDARRGEGLVAREEFGVFSVFLLNCSR